jgi:predicted amidohydrolase YtcJ
MADEKRELVEFVVARAFEPVLRAKPDGRSDADRRRLEHVQRATRSEIERYRHYGSADEVAVNFRRDLSSEAAKKIHAELRRLHLPTIEDVRDEFEEKARELGVASG